MITKEKTKKFIERAYKNACEHGFHDKKLSVEHLMMLVLTEISEAVQADRNRKRANIAMFKRESNTPQSPEHVTKHWQFCFEQFIKDTVEDELADVCIRLYDLCGCFNIKPSFIDSSEMELEFEAFFGKNSFCERCFILSAVICHCDGQSIKEDGSKECLPRIIGGALTFISCICNDMCIDLERHIELKMKYNETRQKNHGKKY